MKANEIRQRFLDFFAANGHQKVSSSGLVPKDDPSLMFTNAGMVQFKRVFLGQEKREYKRATTSQKCLRVGGKHNDLENVGRTARHHTFFEMLGNFSFGDYFKEEAIRLAWDFLTRELALPKDKLYVTVFRDDDEAARLWQKVAGVPAERIYRMGEKDNFWSMGDTGPCGPCSEILIDQGEHMSCGPDCGIGKCDCDRFLEIWNLVFMQYDQITPGERVSLPRPSIDTGMGLERVSAVVQGVFSNYDCDLFQEIIGFAAAKAGVRYKAGSEDNDTALRVMADHCRSMAFMVADGILPSNEGRGYVLRRLIRRAYRFGRLIGMAGAFLHEVAGKVVEVMGDHYPEIRETAPFMARVVREEEDRFSNTLDKGLALLDEELAKLPQGATLAGAVAFKLYDTYGFPIDIVNDVAEKRGLAVDEAGFNTLMAEQKERAKAAWKGSGEVDLGSRFKALLEEGVTSEFVGYDLLAASSRITALLDAAAQPVDRLSTGERGFVVAAATPFYGESGGQLGDTGALETPEGQASVADTLKPAPSLTVHSVEVTSGALSAGSEAVLTVDEEARLATARNHTATHLLHAALRKVLGEHVKQAGSLVGPDRLRFDFTHVSAMTAEEKAQVEAQVNRAVLGDTALTVSSMDHQTAVKKGAMALFNEKYGDTVRVVEVPGVSIELCGGTHLRATGQVGPFLITAESGVAAGVRRIEAATGLNALSLIMGQRRELDDIAGLVKAKPGEIAAKVSGLQKEVKALHKEAERLASQAASGTGRDLMDDVKEINGTKVLAAQVNAPTVTALRDLMDDVRSKLPSGVACRAAAADGKVSLILYVSKDLHAKYTAPTLIKDVAALIGGSGGGRPDLAQAGGTNPDAIPAALAKLSELV